MKKVIFLLGIPLITWIGICTDKETNNMKNNSVNDDSRTEAPLADIKNGIRIDTIGLTKFWNDFKHNVKQKNKIEVASSFQFPIHGIHLLTFHYSYDCDTLAYQNNIDKYLNLDIDTSNFNQYYNYLFTNFFIEMILKTSSQDIIDKGLKFENGKGITYKFFPKDYFNIKCSNDNLLMFHIFKNREQKWKISIGGL